MSDPQRFPASVYAVGDEPDPRFTLANERTFLAWIRTALALLAAAAAVDAFDLPLTLLVERTLVLSLATAGALCAYRSWRNWADTERAMRLGEPLPSDRTMLVLPLLLLLVAVVFIVSSLFTGG